MRAGNPACMVVVGGALRADFACRPCGSRAVTSACRSIALSPFPVNCSNNERGNFLNRQSLKIIFFVSLAQYARMDI